VGEVAQTTYTHVSKCKNNKIKNKYGNEGPHLKKTKLLWRMGWRRETMER
jgi:hypothetical protein